MAVSEFSFINQEKYIKLKNKGLSMETWEMTALRLYQLEWQMAATKNLHCGLNK